MLCAGAARICQGPAAPSPAGRLLGRKAERSACNVRTYRSQQACLELWSNHSAP